MKEPVIDKSLKRMYQSLPAPINLPTHRQHLEFGVFSPQHIKSLSVLELHERNLYDLSANKRSPQAFGVLDKRLGTGMKTELCGTCRENLHECVGHFGVVRLTLPVFHLGYFKHLLTLLQNICKTCSKVLLEEPKRRSFLQKLRNQNMDGVQRRELLKSINTTCKKVNTCPHCASLNGGVKKVGAFKLIHEKFKLKKKTQEEADYRASFDHAVELDPTLKNHVSKAHFDLNPLVVLNILKKISNEDCELMGLDPEFGRPELFIWQALPVPPVSIRPSVGQDSCSTEDDLSVLMSEIVDVNTKMKAIVAAGIETLTLMEHWEYLQLQTAMYITSDLPGVPLHLQKDLTKIKKGLCQRLKGKHGRFRGNLSGKRVDFSGRTVISPDPNLRIDQVAVPQRVAKVLTYPERVTLHNIDRLRKNVVNGLDVWPGARYVIKTNGVKKFLKYVKRDVESLNLKIGDIVERHLEDDDIVLFNRQPSLHKLSIMAHFAKIRPWRTFRFNECVCTPYNADFDGDEMNLHLPQTEEARAEARLLMGTTNNLVTPRNGEPLIAATQDFITCCYLLSRKDVFYEISQFSQICNYIGDSLFEIDLPPPALVKPIRLWTGKQVFSVLMRPNRTLSTFINLETKCRTFTKPTIQLSSGMVLDPSFCPNDGYLTVINSEIISGVVDKSIIGDGSKRSIFYVAMRDYGKELAAAYMNRVAKLSARWMGNQGFSIGIDDVQPGERLSKEREYVVEKGYLDCDELILKSSRGELENAPGSTKEETLESNISGVLSKIRGDLGNTCMKELDKYNAPLIMSLCGSKGSKINVSQMVACVGQQIIAGSRVPDGFGDRSLPHFPKYSKSPGAKGFVKNSFYSGLSPTEFLFHAISGREGLVDTAVKTAETGYMQRRLVKALEDLTVHYDRSVRSSTGGVIQFKYGDDALDPACIEDSINPIEFIRNLKHCQNLLTKSDGSVVGDILLPGEIVSMVENEMTSEKAVKVLSEAFRNDVKEFIRREVVDKIILVRVGRGLDDGMLSISEGAASNSDVKLVITNKQLELFFQVCYKKYAMAMIEPGTACGAIGAQSIGEPGTQMTLKTFHFAGVASMNVTLGVPRIKEIINASKKISTPIIDASLDERFVDNLHGSDTDKLIRLARRVKGRVEKTLLQDVIKYMEEVITSRGCLIKVKLDVDAIQRMQLEINLDTIRASISKAKKLKIPYDQIGFEGEDIIKVGVRPLKNQAEEDVFIRLQDIKRKLPLVSIKGIDSVQRAVISGDGKVKLLVEGLGLREVMGIEGVDGCRTKSNHTLEMWKTLGIEAARNNIIDEIIYTMVSHGMTIDRRHVMLMADLMTFKGEVLGITRFGIAKMRDSVLMLASFEKTTDHLFDASFFGKKDPVEGVSECIIMGVPMSIGTGLFRIIQQLNPVDKLLGKKSLLTAE